MPGGRPGPKRPLPSAFLADQLSTPAAEGIGRDQGVPVTAYPSPEARGLCGPAPALGVGDPLCRPGPRCSRRDAILFLERVTDVTTAAG